MKESDLKRICRIREYCEDINRTIQRFGENKNLFLDDIDYYNSVSMSIMQIGELCNGLTEEFKNETGDQMQWGLIRGMRNMFAHTYFKMDKNIIWDVATKNIPLLEMFCDKIIKNT